MTDYMVIKQAPKEDIDHDKFNNHFPLLTMIHNPTIANLKDDIYFIVRRHKRNQHTSIWARKKCFKEIK